MSASVQTRIHNPKTILMKQRRWRCSVGLVCLMLVPDQHTDPSTALGNLNQGVSDEEGGTLTGFQPYL